MKKLVIASILAGSMLGLAGGASAGSVYLTGHDVDFHGNQNGYANVILNYLRGAGTLSEIAAGSYRIGVLRSNEISGGFADPVGFGTITTADPSTFADGAAFAIFLSGIDVLEIASHTSCGGCDLSTADSDAINAFSPQITAFFNAGGDIYANSGASLSTYYNFLPPGAVASGASISGSTGFSATAAGATIGIVSSMINGFPTHNRFDGFAPAFTVFETRTVSGTTENISIGIRDASIIDGGIGVCGQPGQPVCAVSEPASLALVGLSLAGLAIARRRRRT